MGELRADRGREVLDVRDLDQRRLVGRGDPDGVRAQRAGDAADDDRLLLAVLVAAQQLLAEVVVDGGIGGAAGGAGERDGLGALAVAADQQLGRGGDERRVAAAGAEDVTGLEAAAQHAEDRRRVVGRGRLDGDLAREHDLLERARPDPLDGARDGALVVLGRRDRVDRGSGRPGAGSSSGSGCEPQRGGAGVQARGELLRHVVGRRQRGQREADVVAAARQRHLGDDQVGGVEARPVRRVAAVGREREPAERDQPGAGRPVGRRRRPRPRSAPASPPRRA